MDDDEIFDRSMASLGVEPLAGERPGRLAASRDQRRDEDDGRLFEQAMRELDDGGDRPAARPRPPARPKVRRLKTRPKNLRVDDQIDLHGLRAEAALKRLEHFVAGASASGLRAVLVITGKGHHSPGGRGVLRQRVEDWIRERGGRRLRSWSEAPRRLGGRGALVLYLRASSK